MKSKKNGFTLVELLAVIVILAIILVIAVPKVMSIIEDAKMGTLESTAKMIASQAEKAKVQNAVLGKDEKITCESVAKLNDVDYASCSIKFNASNQAQVTIEGKGKFNNLYVCSGTKTNSIATEEECGLICSEQEATIEVANPTKPYVVEDYNSCVSYLKNDFQNNFGSLEELKLLCKGEGIHEISIRGYISELVNGYGYTKEELINNNVLSSDSVFEPNITVGKYDSCVTFMNEIYIEQGMEGADEQVPSICSGNGIDNGPSTSDIFNITISNGWATEAELIENNVVGSDSSFIDYKIADKNSCVNYTKNIWVDNLGKSIESLQTLCSNGKTYYTLNDYVNQTLLYSVFTEKELIENNVIKGSINEKKVCMPNYGKAVTYINKLYDDISIRNKYGLIKDDTADENIRYSGKNVQNYVEFGNNGELWRIIGTFKVEKTNGSVEELVKIVRDSVLDTAMSWDSSALIQNSGAGVNEWSQADLKNMLNTYYIGESTTCTYCNGIQQNTCKNSCNNSVAPINSTYMNMIESVVWNTGAVEYNASGVTPLQAYNAERVDKIGSNGEGTGKTCTQGSQYCNDKVERTIEWEGKVGLIYPSDFGYAGGSICTSIISFICDRNNWLSNGAWNWTISPFPYPTGNADGVWCVGTSSLGYVADFESVHMANAVRPALYLKSDVKIVSGDGSENNPYKLSI